ncbi:PCRF domain-containing protein [Candidatus Carsonella ruddii]|uniref:PCRF domain-containing protein n=3 Tax=cellular organisms TaxID=131567 RepID=A0AAJ6JYB6_CARRU|nr:peptide chain release factor-like protein [Candidatus Carsonella ruddii]WGS66610.1 PCRF domain-containing protein [Candidatus Carsonella ruddii]WGS66807.1 PCRF domain-containing protein [Candidatus Carsonella ruddii]WGS66999.1 PCRF domain-containing protein [Candidatus Carsonella ruddii]WGS67190.1 PCRF domain-containing protein [Candidatus Carsonella ruddii]WMC18207.1 MAG: PCRF domain-containing protein [Candidatus Carsonella ruddii]
MYKNLIKNIYIKNILIKNFLIYNEKEFLNSKFNFLNLKNYDKFNCYMEIYPDAGGIETQQLIKFFTDFYIKWFQKNFFNIVLIYKDIGEYGYKKVLIFINNCFSFFLVKNESGIHRIIRKNPLLSNSKIQTSYLNVKILPEFDEINENLNKKEILIETFKSKGPGGQHVNNTNSAVRITHIPTNIIVSCQSERSQIKNKINALKTLNYKILVKKKTDTKKFLNSFNIEKKYIKTYYFDNNLIIDHIKNKKYNLNDYFKLNIDFLNLC